MSSRLGQGRSNLCICGASADIVDTTPKATVLLTPQNPLNPPSDGRLPLLPLPIQTPLQSLANRPLRTSLLNCKAPLATAKATTASESDGESVMETSACRKNKRNRCDTLRFMVNALGNAFGAFSLNLRLGPNRRPQE